MLLIFGHSLVLVQKTIHFIYDKCQSVRVGRTLCRLLQPMPAFRFFR